LHIRIARDQAWRNQQAQGALPSFWFQPPLADTMAGDMSTEREILGLTLAAARVGAGMSQRELAAKTETNASQICRWEQGKQMPGALVVGRIAHAVGLQTQELYQLYELVVRSYGRRTGKPLDPTNLATLGTRDLKPVLAGENRERAAQLLTEALAILTGSSRGHGST
jgi:transcriptional regulator with XRE-family HTH domain